MIRGFLGAHCAKLSREIWPLKLSRRAMWLLPVVAILALYLVSPALTATHFEVLSAQIHINAIASNEHRLSQANVLYPIHIEYFYLSRIGVVYLVQLFARIFGSGDVAFRGVIICSFAIYLAASIIVARRYVQVSPLAALLALLLTPGIVCLGFFFNDNVVSEAFAFLGLALLPHLQRAWTFGASIRAILSGFLFGFAILARTDGFLILPIAFSLMLLETREIGRIIASLLCASAGLCLALLLPYVLSGVSVLQIYQIGRFFQQVHDDMPRGHISMAILVILFLGLPNLLLLAVGGRINLQNRGMKPAIILALTPALLAIFFAGHALETRMFFPFLGPYVAMHAGRGLDWIWQGLQKASSSPRPVLLLLLVLTGWCLPPIYTPNKEGPRPVVGQLWAPLLWHRWQSEQQAELAEASMPLNRAEPKVAVVTLNYTTDAFLRLRLWETGYRPIAVRSVAGTCKQDFETWRKGGHVVFAVRTENPHQFVPESHDYIEAAELAAAFRCPSLWQGEPVFAYGSGVDTADSAVARYVKDALPALVPSPLWLGWPRALSTFIGERLPSNFYEPLTIVQQHIVLLSKAQVSGLVDAAKIELARQKSISPGHLRPLTEIRNEWGFHFWRPKVRPLGSS
jgi:hypothetical protein